MANPEDLGRYRLKRLLGRGALGQVWEALDREAEATKFAVKIMHAADEELTLARIQFSREARLAALLRHPNVARVHDSGEAAGTSFMVMEMVEGTPLRRFIGDASVSVDERLRWLRQIGEGIAALHAGNIVHRDVKPENVIIRPDRSACLVDFGIAKWRKFESPGERDPLELDAEPFAPPVTDYAPPEAIEAHLYDELGDQYAWGALAYALLTGEPPIDGAAPLAAREGIPADVAEVVERARSRERKQRWGSMPELLDAFEGGRSSEPSPPKSGGSGSGGPAVSRTAKTDAPPPSGGAALDTSAAEEPPPERRSPDANRDKSRSSLVLVGAAALALLALVGLLWAGLR